MTVRYRNIARVVRTHGRRGEVVAEALRGLPFLVHPGMSVALTPPALKRDRFCDVLSVRDQAGQFVVEFSGIDSLTDAEGIVGCYMLAREGEVELGPLDASLDELRGREVVDDRFGSLGRIRDILETLANDVWVVDGGPFGEVLIPVIEDAVDSIPETGALRTHIMDGLISSDAFGSKA